MYAIRSYYVKAGIVSSALIVVIAFTAVASFIVYSLNEAISLFRLISLILGSTMGIYGIIAGAFVMLIHATSLRSFGVPYMSPISPVNRRGLKDFIIRFPLWTRHTGGQFFSDRNKDASSGGGD